MSGPAVVVERATALRGAVATIPTAQAWRRCALIYLAFLACALPIGVASGLLHIAIVPLTPSGAALALGAILVHPAFTEEMIFRAALLPRRPASLARGRVAIAVFLALVLYVAAHPLNAWLFWPAALDVFANAWYLALTTLLGLACTAAYFVSGSIWPCVLIHWATVSLWLFALGGQALLGGQK